MKKKATNIIWFDDDGMNRPLRASIGRDEKLYLGTVLSKALPADIRLGFDEEEKTVLIANGHGRGRPLPKAGALKVPALCKALHKAGLTLPLSFVFEKDETMDLFVGRVVVEWDKQKGYDMERMLCVYRYLIEQAVQKHARSMPREERRADAIEAFCNAVRAYEPKQGDIKEYLEKQLYIKLAQKNRQYTRSWNQAYLDAPLQAGTSFTLGDIIAHPALDGIAQVEERLTEESYFATLSAQESRLVKLLACGWKVPQIARELDVTEEEVIELAGLIGRKKKEYFLMN